MSTGKDILSRIKARLPHNTQRVVEILGWEGALKFLRRNGDKKRYVPTQYSSSHCLFKDMTKAQADKIINTFGGLDVRWPNHKKMLEAERNQEILSDLDRGFDLCMVASKYNIAKSTVVRVVQRLGVTEGR